jgi:hypothetical protein
MIPLAAFVWAALLGFLAVLAAWTGSPIAFGSAFLAATMMILAVLDEKGDA